MLGLAVPGRGRVVENCGSEARDHLANERTFLAWVRTALALVGLGALFARMFDPAQRGVVVVAAALVAVGISALVYAMYRYERVAARLLEGRFPVARRGPILLAAALLVIVVGALMFVGLAAPS
jgi:putative membrane protein